jgi:hypothetical protein
LEPIPGPIGFVKPPDVYANQKEVRMLWIPKCHGESIGPTLVQSRSITKLCARIA